MWNRVQPSVAAQQLNFCSCLGTANFTVRPVRAGLSFAHRAGADFINSQLLNPVAAARKCLPLFTRLLEMIFDIMTVLFVLGLDLLSRLISRRRDVLNYVSK